MLGEGLFKHFVLNNLFGPFYSKHVLKQAQRRIAAEIAARKSIEHFLHSMYKSSRHRYC